MQPAAIHSRVQDAKPLGEIYEVFKKYAERKFSGDTSLKHIERADIPKARGLDWMAQHKNPDWTNRRRANERRKLISGLAVYLFDRFLRDEHGRVRNVLLRLQSGDDFTLGELAFTFVGEQDFCRIDFRNHPSQVRGRLIEIAGNQNDRYRFIETEFWEVTRDTNWQTSLNYEDYFVAKAVWSEIGCHAGAALYFNGKLPREKQIDDIMGFAARFSDEHIRELVDEIHEIAKVVPLETMYRERVAKRIGVKLNTRTFNQRIWAQFRSELSEEHRSRLPGRGKPAREPK